MGSLRSLNLSYDMLVGSVPTSSWNMNLLEIELQRAYNCDKCQVSATSLYLMASHSNRCHQAFIMEKRSKILEKEMTN